MNCDKCDSTSSKRDARERDGGERDADAAAALVDYALDFKRFKTQMLAKSKGQQRRRRSAPARSSSVFKTLMDKIRAFEIPTRSTRTSRAPPAGMRLRSTG